MKNDGLKKVSSLRVVIDVGQFDPKVGAANDIIDICRVGSTNFDITFLFCSDNSKDECSKLTEYATYVPLKSLAIDKKQPFQYLKNVFQWIIFLKKENIDAVHINYHSWGNASLLAAYLLGINTVSRAGLNPKSKSPSLKLIRAYVANCKEQAQHLLSSNYRDKVNVVGDLVNVNKLKNAKPLVKPLFNNSQRLKVLYVGQLTERKGIHILLEAIANMNEKPSLALVGGDWNSDGFPQSLKKILHEKNLSGDVILEGHRDDVPSILKEADILVLPSLSEARPRIILEAMFLGKCVIASAVGGIPDMICNNETGLLVEANEPLKLTAILNALQNDKTKINRISQNAFEFAQKNLLPEHTVAKYIEIYANSFR